MKNLRVFETETAYNSAVSEFEYPTVSFVQDVEDVRYMPKPEYLTFEALENGTFTLNIPANVNSTYMTSVSYSTDDGENWTTTTVDNTAQTITTPTINAGDKVLWKGVGKQTSYNFSIHSIFSSTGNFNVSGNIMSLLYGDNFVNQTEFASGSSYNFTYLFGQTTKLINAENLILPATTLTANCYRDMFYNCTSLTTAPSILPATTLANNCYSKMFYGCTALTTAPELPATTLAYNCYKDMFNGCTSLITSPELPATTLVEYCYQGMFYGCTSLTTAPELPATTLAVGCYSQMFYNCTSLITAPVLPATTLEGGCYGSMFKGCTSLTTAPELPATTLVSNCYGNMFNGCKALTTAPVLPATTLTNSCYEYMFRSCSKLNYIKAMFTTEPSTTYTSNWVNGVKSTGTFVKNSAATWNVTGIHGIPTGWTVQTASA